MLIFVKNYITMKYFASLLVIVSLLCSCSDRTPDEPERPGTEPNTPETPEEYHDIDFADTNVSELNVDEEDGSIHIILYRKASASTKAYSCGLRLTEGSDFASIASHADFPEGGATAGATLNFSPSRMGREQRTVTVGIADSDKSWQIIFRRTADKWTEGGPMLMFDGNTFRQIGSRWRREGDRTEWILGGGDQERRFTIVKDIPEIIATAGVTGAAAYGKAEIWPAVGVSSYFSDDIIALNLCDITDGSPAFPHTEYFFRRSGEYAVATICDGWLLPVLAIDSKLLDPGENRWKAPARIDSDGTITIFGPYHNNSPVHRVNGAPLEATWNIDVNGSTAAFTPQFSCFTNKDVFDFEFMIAAEGLYDDKNERLSFETPFHNCNENGLRNNTVNCSWGRIEPLVIELSERSRIEH